MPKTRVIFEKAGAFVLAMVVLFAAFALLGGIMELIDWIDGEFISQDVNDRITDDIRRELSRPGD